MSAPKIAIITGAARGIGYSISASLASLGHSVILVDRIQDVHESARKLRSQGLSADAYVADIANRQSANSLFDYVNQRFGAAHILVNNAGISPKHQGAKLGTTETSLKEWNEVLDVNLNAPFHLCQLFLPLMKKEGWGRIIMMSSLAARTGSKLPPTSYAASKAGLIGLARVLADEFGRNGITVNCVAPGRIATPMTDASGEDVQREYALRIPVGRLGSPEDISSAVAFLSSDEASFITGAVLDVNGGVFTN